MKYRSLHYWRGIGKEQVSPSSTQLRLCTDTDHYPREQELDVYINGRLYITAKDRPVSAYMVGSNNCSTQAVPSFLSRSKNSLSPSQTFAPESPSLLIPLSSLAPPNRHPYSSSPSSPTLPNNPTTSGKCARSILFRPSASLFTTRPNRLFVTFRSSSGSVQHR